MTGIFQKKISTVIICLFVVSLIFAIVVMGAISIYHIEKYNNHANKVTKNDVTEQAYHFLNVFTQDQADRFAEILNDTNSLLAVFANNIDNIYSNNLFINKTNNNSTAFKFIPSNGFYIEDNNNIRTAYNSNFGKEGLLPHKILHELNALSAIDSSLMKIKNSYPFYNLTWIETVSGCFKGYPSKALLNPQQYPKNFKFRYSDNNKAASFSKIENGNEGLWSPIYLTVEKALAFSRAFPIYNNGKYWGAVGVDISLDSIYKNITAFVGNKNKKINNHIYMILDNDGKLITLNRDNLGSIGIDNFLIDNLNINDSANVNIKSSIYNELSTINKHFNNNKVNHTLKIEKTEYIFVAYPIKSTPWTLVNLIPQSSVLNVIVERNAKLNKIKTSMIIHFISIAAIFAIIFTIIVLFLIKKYLLSPLQILIKGLKTVSKGNSKPYINTSIQSGELKEATDAFNDMIKQLRLSDKKIMHYQNHLENLVDKRTAIFNERIKIEQLVNYISNEFMKIISQENFDHTLNKALRKLGTFFDMDFAYLNLNAYSKEQIMIDKLPYHWKSPKAKTYMLKPGYKFTHAFKTLKAKKPYIFSDINKDLPPEAINDKKIFKSNSIVSFACFPMVLGNKLRGWLTISSQHHKKKLTKEDIELLQTVVDIITSSVVRINYAHEIVKEKEKAEDATKAKSVFLANMSHDIRTPIHVILGNSELLKQEINNTSVTKKLQAITSSGKILLSLINNILDFSKIETGKIDLNNTPIDFRFLIKDLDIFFMNIAKNKRISLQFLIDDNFPELVRIDVDYLKRVLVNIISNAFKVTEHGYVKINISHINKNNNVNVVDIVIAVEDTGIGIPKDKRDLIFKPFAQINNVNGTGLGLSIAKNIISQMGGDIKVGSNVGKGTIFKIYLYGIKVDRNLSKAENYSGVKFSVLDNKPVLKGINILITDDLKENRTLLREYVKETGACFFEAENGIKALEILKDNSIDLLILDYKMPALDGIETIKIIRKGGNIIPIIFLTASSLPEVKREAKKAGCNIFLQKPICKNDLIISLVKLFPQRPVKIKQAKPKLIIEKANAQLNIPIDMMDQLNKIFIPEWQEVKDSFIITKYRDFIKELILLCKKYKSDFGKEWIDCISIDLDSFMLSDVKEKFLEFYDLVEEVNIHSK